MLNHCYNKISKTPTGSIILLHSFLKRCTYNVFYFILWYSFAKKEYNILLYPKY